MEGYFHASYEAMDYIDGLGYLLSYHVEEPGFDYRPHFHIFNPWTGKNVAICYKENRYADPNNHNRLTKEECKILNDWMNKEISYRSPFDPNNSVCNKWDGLRDSLHVPDREWIDKHLPIQPDYTTIEEPLPLEVKPTDIKNHARSFNIIWSHIPGVGELTYYCSEDPRLYLRPHFHIVTEDGKNVQICAFTNKYADPDDNNKLSKEQCIKLNEWVNSYSEEEFCGRKMRTENYRLLLFNWDSDCDREFRCELPSEMINDKYKIPDYSTILDADPIKTIYDGPRTNVVTIGRCHDIGNILFFLDDDSIYGHVPHFYLQRLEELIPIGIQHSIYLDPTSTRLTSNERQILYDWMKKSCSPFVGKGEFTNWDFIVMAYVKSVSWYCNDYTERARKWKMPNYKRIRQHKIACKDYKY